MFSINGYIFLKGYLYVSWVHFELLNCKNFETKILGTDYMILMIVSRSDYNLSQLKIFSIM